jgi:type I restriction enzyme S subunit
VQLSLDDIACLPVTMPPMDEQQATVTFLEQELHRIDKVRLGTEAAVGLLRERRSALISAAVTGKIDVRGFVQDAA